MIGWPCLVLACGCIALAGCGNGGDHTSSEADTSNGAPPASDSQPSTPNPSASSGPGCSHYCQQAAPGGGIAIGCDVEPKRRVRCPGSNDYGSKGCLDLLSTTAQVGANGVFTVSVQCNLSTPCKGAFLVL